MKKLVVFLMVLGLFVGGSSMASASLLFDRGLPTANLNNAAGDNRSNVTWAFGGANADYYNLTGDDFAIGGSGNYMVNTIRIWSTNNTGLSMWFGPEGGTLSQLSGSPTISSVTYSDLSIYQGSSGSYRPIYELDFSLNQVLSGSTTYQFFLDGPIAIEEHPTAGFVTEAYLHSSNASLSGSTQQGADNLYLWAYKAVTDVYGSPGQVYYADTIDSNGYGWDKSSDANVQVFGTNVPEPATMLLLGLGLMGIAGIRRKLRK